MKMLNELLVAAHRQNLIYFMIGSLISADNNITEDDKELNKQELENIIVAFEEISNHKIQKFLSIN